MISIVINCDTRPGCDREVTTVGEFDGSQPSGCRSYDFLIDGVINKNRFLRGHEVETILYIDEVEPIPANVMQKLSEMKISGEITKLIISQEDKTVYRWNDLLYIKALRYANGDYIVHFDGDTAAFRSDDSDIIPKYIRWLDGNYKYICQPSIADSNWQHISTRFFITKKEYLDLDEAGKCLNVEYKENKYGNIFTPCLEHILGMLAGEKQFLYPYSEFLDYCIFCWGKYYKGSLGKLNKKIYQPDIYNYLFKNANIFGGANDFYGEKIEEVI